MHIQKIKIQNFKSIYDPLELCFNDISGFWRICGDVGSGKTTIGEAIIYGLFGSINGKNNADLISWGCKHAIIELWCTSKDRNIYIRREINAYGQSPTYIEIDGEELMISNKRNAQQQLEKEYYDTSRTMVELLCIISFNNFKSLATMGAKDIKIFLDKILGFQVLTQYSESCKALKQANYNNIQQTQRAIDSITAQITKIEELSNMSIIDGDIKEIKADIASLEQDVKKYKKNREDILNSLDALIRKHSDELTTVVTLGKNKSKEIQLIERGICPTCGASIDDSQLDIKRREREILAEQYQNVLKNIEAAKLERSKKLSDVDRCLEDINKSLQSKHSHLIRLEEQSRRSSISEGTIQDLKSQRSTLEDTLTELTKEDAEWCELYEYLAVNIRQHILRSFIPSLNNNIAEYSQLLQQPYTICFDEDFKCYIHLNSFGSSDQSIVPTSSLSTGQLKTVDMIIILGVLKSIISTSNINVMFLDELFSNLDDSLRDKMCNLLKSSIEPNHTLFIISHQPIDNISFDGQITMRLESLPNMPQSRGSIATIEKLRS